MISMTGVQTWPQGVNIKSCVCKISTNRWSALKIEHHKTPLNMVNSIIRVGHLFYVFVCGKCLNVLCIFSAFVICGFYWCTGRFSISGVFVQVGPHAERKTNLAWCLICTFICLPPCLFALAFGTCCQVAADASMLHNVMYEIIILASSSRPERCVCACVR